MKKARIPLLASIVAAIFAAAVVLAPTEDVYAGDGGTDCVGDLNGDGFVGVQDLLDLLSQWGMCDGCSGDLDMDGDVDVQDLLMLLENFGPCDPGVECQSPADCDDNDPCTFDLCIAGNCVNFPIPDCGGK